MPPKPRRAPSPTHFLALPLCTSHSLPSLANALRRLTESISSASSARFAPANVDAAAKNAPLPSPELLVTAVRPPTTIHLTLGVLVLPDPAAIERARARLRYLDVQSLLRAAKSSGPSRATPASSSAPPSPLDVHLRGVHVLSQPQATSVLFAEPVDESGRLQSFSESVRAHFADVGLVEEKRALKLHATLLNTIYADRRQGVRPQHEGAEGSRTDETTREVVAGDALKNPGQGEEHARSRTAAATLSAGERAVVHGKPASKDDVHPLDETGREGATVDQEATETVRPASQAEHSIQEAQDHGHAVGGQGRKGRRSKKLTFDARWLIAQRQDEEWAEARIEKVALCEMGAKPNENGALRYVEIEEKKLA